MNFAAEMDATRRLAILQLMIQEGGRSNDAGLLTALRAIGHAQEMSMGVVRRLLGELEARACVTTSMFRDTLMVAEVTDRGRAAAAGDTTIDGIASPRLGY
jgi:hypothetical protein